LMLFFTGVTRFASDIAKVQVNNTIENNSSLRVMSEQVDEALNIIASPTQSLDDFGRLLDDAWSLKRSLSNKVSSSFIDDIYQNAKSNGALGGKLLGAGGGGFMLIYANPQSHVQIKESLNHLIHIPFEFENSGSTISIYHPE